MTLPESLGAIGAGLVGLTALIATSIVFGPLWGLGAFASGVLVGWVLGVGISFPLHRFTAKQVAKDREMALSRGSDRGATDRGATSGTGAGAL